LKTERAEELEEGLFAYAKENMTLHTSASRGPATTFDGFELHGGALGVQRICHGIDDIATKRTNR
jgi:hypothetical protein